MGLNLDALKEVQENLNNRSGGGGILYDNKLGEEVDVRILPPLPHMNGIYFQQQNVVWINGKTYIDPSTFGLQSVLEEEISAAKEKAKTDKQLEALLKDWKKFKQETRYVMPILLLEVTFDAKNNPVSVKVTGDKAQFFVCRSAMLKSINALVTGRLYQNGTEFGIFDREKGRNMILSKTGVKLDTDYKAQAWPDATVMEEKYYKDIPDVVKFTKDAIKSDAYLRGVIRNYFYGEALPSEESSSSDAATTTSTTRTKTAVTESKDTTEAKKEVTSTGRTRPQGNLLDNVQSLVDD